VQNGLESTFYDMQCAKGGDVHVFLTSLWYKHEELSAAGVSISDKEYQRMVLKGIPEELTHFASGILSSAHIFKASAVNTETLIDHICEEADWLKNHHAKSQSKDPGAKSSVAGDDALAATGSGGKKKRHKGDCHNCGKAGHWAQDCRSPKKEKLAEDNAKAGKTDKAQKSKTKPVRSANAVVTQDKAVEDECWAVKLSLGASDPSDDLIDESDWLCEVEETAMAVITPVSDDRGECVELYDSGATCHISPYKSDFATYTTLDPPVYLNAANQQWFPAVGTGTLSIRVPKSAASSTLTLHEVLHVPAVGYTLVSIGALDKKGYHMSIGGRTLELFSPRGKRVACIPQTTQGLYHTTHVEESANSVETISIMELHRRMGHIVPTSACALVEKGLVTGIRLDPNSQEADCEACLFARATRKPILKVCICPCAQSFGDEVHSDVWGLSSIATKHGCRYFVTFTDEATHYMVTYLMCTKAEAFSSYKAFEAWALVQQLCAVIKVLCSDRSGEYLSGAFNQHLAAAGTARHLTVHNTLQLNGVAERLNRTIVEHIRVFTHSSGLPKFLWGEALRHATWLKNRMATCALDGLTPYQAVFGCAPDVSRLRRWGAMVWVHVGNGDKFAARVHKGRWLGFDTESRAHRIYFPSSHSVATEHNVYFSMAPQLEGEQLAIPGTESEQCATLPTPTTSTPVHSTSTILPPALPPTQVPLPPSPSPTVTLPSPLSSRSSSPSPPPAVTCVVPNLQERPTRNHKPAPILCDLLEGVTMSSS
jgi:hypothetical protein